MFEELGLKKEIVDALKNQNITTPTSIQSLVIPRILEGKDIIAKSITGTGKTLAYVLPIVEKINTKSEEESYLDSIIIVPTHELALQVQKEVENIAKYLSKRVTNAVIIGNVNIKRQIERLKTKPNIVIGTPGRILELIKMRKITAHTVKTIVIDEADTMLNKNNIENTKAVIKTTLADRQLLLFSATISNKIENLANEIMKNPEFIKSDDKFRMPDSINHMFFVCEKRDKIDTFKKIAYILKPKKAIVFINNTEDIVGNAIKLKHDGMNVGSIHGRVTKEDRKRAMEEFKNGTINYLVASDIAARGLHIENIDCIFNISIPEESEEYLHRGGRTGRNGEKGLVVSIVTTRELAYIAKYQKELKISILERKMSYGKII